MIYTTYFANLKNLPSNLIPISIALYDPKWYVGERCDLLAPMKYILTKYKNGVYSASDYIREYTKQLEATDIWSVYDSLKRKAKKDTNLINEIALVCYESPEKFCHRHIVAEWFEKHGFAIREFEDREGMMRSVQ